MKKEKKNEHHYKPQPDRLVICSGTIGWVTDNRYSMPCIPVAVFYSLIAIFYITCFLLHCSIQFKSNKKASYINQEEEEETAFSLGEGFKEIVTHEDTAVYHRQVSGSLSCHQNNVKLAAIQKGRIQGIPSFSVREGLLSQTLKNGVCIISFIFPLLMFMSYLLLVFLYF